MLSLDLESPKRTISSRGAVCKTLRSIKKTALPCKLTRRADSLIMALVVRIAVLATNI